MALMVLTDRHRRSGRRVRTPCYRGLELFILVARVVLVDN